jgi:hypothetical protein
MERDNLFGNGAIAALVLVIAIAFYWAKNSWGPSSAYVKLPESESYEMGKAQSTGTNEYDLSGRKIVQTVNDPNAAVVALAPANAVSAAVPAAAVSNAVAGKNPAHSASQAAADGKKRIEEIKRRARMNINVVDSSTEKMRGFENTKANTQNPQQANVGYAQPNLPAAAANTGESEPEEKPKMTAAQWRAVLFADPSANSVRNFASAYEKGEIKAGEFYQISESLFKDTAPDRQTAGLLAFSLDTSVKSFTTLASHHQAAETSDEMKTRIYSVLRTYGDAGKLPVLSRIFYLNDTASLTLATRILEQTLAVQKRTAVQDNRAGRGPVSLAIPPSSFQAFLAPLNRLLTNQEAGLSGQAQALIDAIKSLSNA